MSIGMILLVALTLLILFGVLERVLDRMALTDRQALTIVACIFVGGLLPDIPFGLVTVNPGGALVPLLVCLWLLFHAGSAGERIRAVVSALLTAGAITIISRLFPSDPVAMPFDPMILYGVSGGVIAWLLGRSRRSAFFAGVVGMVLSDLLVGFLNWRAGIMQTVHLGGAGALDAVVLSGVIAVLLCELVGEAMERMTTGRAASSHEDGAIEGGNRA